MSTLFNALQKLEKQKTDGPEVPLPRLASPAPGKANRPFRLLWLLFAVMLLAGAGLAGLSWYLQSQIPPLTSRKIPPPPANAPLPASTPLEAPVPEPVSLPAAEQNSAMLAALTQHKEQSATGVLPSAKSTKPVPIIDNTEEYIRALFADELVLAEKSRAGDRHIHRLANHGSTAGDQPISSVDNKHLAGEKKQKYSPAEISTTIHADRAKRLLYQAERARQMGDMASASQFFAKSWQTLKDPAVANNLAATLIEQKKFTEALAVLNEALRLAPGDEDLLHNQKIARESL